jgi:hypothetical protein
LSFREKLAERNHAEDVKALAMALPLGATRVRARVKCAECGKVWERKVRISDPRAPEAFEELVKNARLHEGLYDHRPVELTMEAL